MSARIWAIVFALRALYGRAALLIENSFKSQTYNDWRSDSGTDQILRGILPEPIVDGIKQKPFGGLSSAIEHLEAEFLVEAGLRK